MSQFNDPWLNEEVIHMTKKLGQPKGWGGWWYWYPTWGEIRDLPTTILCPISEICT